MDFLSTLNTNTNVTVFVTGGNDGLESGSLTSLGLLLDGQDAHDFIEEFLVDLLLRDKFLYNWCLLDWDGMSIDFFEGFDVTSSH